MQAKKSQGKAGKCCVSCSGEDGIARATIVGMLVTASGLAFKTGMQPSEIIEIFRIVWEEWAAQVAAENAAKKPKKAGKKPAKKARK